MIVQSSVNRKGLHSHNVQVIVVLKKIVVSPGSPHVSFTLDLSALLDIFTGWNCLDRWIWTERTTSLLTRVQSPLTVAEHRFGDLNGNSSIKEISLPASFQGCPVAHSGQEAETPLLNSPDFPIVVSGRGAGKEP